MTQELVVDVLTDLSESKLLSPEERAACWAAAQAMLKVKRIRAELEGMLATMKHRVAAL